MKFRRLTAIESQDVALELSEDEAQALARAGRDLASTSTWWGEGGPTSDERSVINVRKLQGDRWSVRITDAVGLVSVGSAQISVQPKIPLQHLLYLLAASGRFPRVAPQAAEADVDKSLWSLVASWYVTALDRLLRRDLLRDYQPVRDVLPAARGRIDALKTGQDYYAGRFAFTSTYHEFSRDMPINRVLLHAARVVRSSAGLEDSVRRGARRAMVRMDEVGEMQPADLRHPLDRRMGYYREPLTLAHHVIRLAGRSFAHGSAIARTFLIRTPEMVEEGLRKLLQSSFGAEHRVGKKGRQVLGATMTFNPDLVFDHGIATGDVKYKLVKGDWSQMRADLYQAIAFATLFRTQHAMIIRFRTDERAPAPGIKIGHLSVTPFEWDAREGVSPEEALTALAGEISLWLDEVGHVRSSP